MAATARILRLPPLTTSERLALAQKLIDSVVIETSPISDVRLEVVRCRKLAIDPDDSDCKTVEEVLERLLRCA